MAEEGAKNSKVILITVVVVALLAGLLYWLMPSDRYNWYTHSYAEQGLMADEPYGSELFYNYLRLQRDDSLFAHVDSTLEVNLRPYIDNETTDATYIINGWFTYLDSAALSSTLQFVEQGNSFFLISEVPPSALMDEVIGGNCLLYWQEYDDYGSSYADYMIEDTTVRANFVHPDLKSDQDYLFENRVRSHGEPFRWYYAKEDLFCEDNLSAAPLATIDDQVNFFRIPYGQGYFYFHTTPKLFTNYYIVEADGAEYTSAAMAHLAPGEIIFDRKKWLRDYIESPMNSSYGQREGPLRFILQQTSLRWGFYLLLAAGSIMLLFAFQRRQRIIPVILPRENSSLEYVDTVTELYLQNNGEGRIFNQLRDQFFLHVRERYRIPTTDLGPGFVSRLSQLADVEPQVIDAVLGVQARGAHLPNVTSELLAEYYQKLEHFYIQAK